MPDEAFVKDRVDRLTVIRGTLGVATDSGLHHAATLRLPQESTLPLPPPLALGNLL
jgi:hypothetical protein